MQTASSGQHNFRHTAPRRMWSLLLRTVWIWLLLTAAAFNAASASATPLLWQFVAPEGSWPTAPEDVLSRFPLRLNAEVLQTLQSGQRVLVEVGTPAAARQLEVEIGAETRLINGDRSFVATLLDQESQVLVLTVGEEAVFAHLETPSAIWQLQAVRRGAEFVGWVYERNLSALARQHDYVIPDRSGSLLPGSRPALISPLPAPQRPAERQPLIIGPIQGGSLASPAGNGGIHAGNISITQDAPSAVLAGQAVTVTIAFRNTANESHRNLAADIYFVLENSALIAASAGCVSGDLSGQPVLRCPLGDMAPGGTSTISYTVRTSEASRPYLTSTAIIGSARQDTFVNVVGDVVTDADGDGISDFNERLLGSDPFNPASVDRSKSVIDVMALYTPDAQAQYGGHAETRINQLISVANQIFADSGVDIILRPVFHRQVDAAQADDMDTMLDGLTRGQGPFSQVAQWRQIYGADLVMLFRPQRAERDRCGLANLGGNDTLGDFSAVSERDYAFALMAIDCPVSSVVAHEVGHNLGLTHSHREDGFGGTFPFATGYGVDGQFATVMAHPGMFNTATRIARFSNPLLDCNGHPCGIDHQHATEGADAARALNLVRHQVAAYFPTQVPELPGREVASSEGGPTDARIASAASTNAGLSFVRQVAPGQVLDLTASLYIDSRHVGQPGVFHVLVESGGEYFTLTEQGLANRQWNGTIADLAPFFAETAPLRVIENLRVLTGLYVDPAFAGAQVRLYVAYRVSGTGELIFTPEPLIIDITP